MSVTNGGEHTASELVRLEISELKDYADELTAEVGQEVRDTLPRKQLSYETL